MGRLVAQFIMAEGNKKTNTVVSPSVFVHCAAVFGMFPFLPGIARVATSLEVVFPWHEEFKIWG